MAYKWRSQLLCATNCFICMLIRVLTKKSHADIDQYFNLSIKMFKTLILSYYRIA